MKKYLVDTYFVLGPYSKFLKPLPCPPPPLPLQFMASQLPLEIPPPAPSWP